VTSDEDEQSVVVSRQSVVVSRQSKSRLIWLIRLDDWITCHALRVMRHFFSRQWSV